MATSTIPARTAAELAAGYAALNALSEIFGYDRVSACTAGGRDSLVAAAIGATVLDALSLSRPVYRTSASGIPLTRRTV